MKTDKFILGLSLLALVACSESEVTDRPEPTPGADVKFGVSLDKTDTRTIYGDEDGNKFPIYWVQDDQVLVNSAQCLTGRQTGTYKISVDTKNQNFASSMTKVGDAGVQWGNSVTANFYSVYPADKASVLSEGNFKLTMPEVQRLKVEAPASGTTVLKSYPDMDACFMTAKTLDVANGSDVLLHYQPLSTAVRFTLKIDESSTAEVVVSQIKIVADKPITGDFSLDLTRANPVVKAGTKTSNEVILYSYYDNGAYLTLKTGQSVELNAFLIPFADLTVNSNWQLQLTTASNETWTISLAGSATSTNGNQLQPGKIHRIKKLKELNINSKWDASKWMEYIPRNVYLSEISIPGSWNTLNVDHQSLTETDDASLKKEITDEYTAGVRAFHLDTRWRASRSGYIGNYKYTNQGLSLACGGKDNTYDAGSGNATKVMRDGVLLFKDALSTIVSQVKPKEYMIVFCTFAQNSYDFNDGTSWMEAVSQACDDMPNVLDGSEITEKTVVDDVLGKVIVIVNCASEVRDINRDDLPRSSKCLFTYTPLVLNKQKYQGSKYKEGRIYKISNSQVTESGFGMVSSQAQIMAELNVSSGFESSERGYGPTVSERKQKSQDILSLSKDNYEKGVVSHLLYYHGLGGYSMYRSWGLEKSSDNQSDVAREFNNWIDGIVKNMSATPTGNQTTYYPVGVVLMNHVLSYTDVVKDILSLNNKYHKAYDPNRSPLGTDGGVTTVQSAAPGYSAGWVNSKTDAISPGTGN
ncbi:MAG: hypothetical protein MSK32_08045 [Paraprevotella sp.]|nr:hypothetical protein [Paraprevotella sp.]